MEMITEHCQVLFRNLHQIALIRSLKDTYMMEGKLWFFDRCVAVYKWHIEHIYLE